MIETTPTTRYTSGLEKGQGAVQETLTLLRFWEPGMTTDELTRRVLDEGILARSTASRTKDIVRRTFARRYLVDGGRPAGILMTLVERGVDLWSIKQLMLLFTARDQEILRDFITDVYWVAYQEGAHSLSGSDAMLFIRSAIKKGDIPSRWADSMVSRVGSGIIGTLADFGMLVEQHGTAKEFVNFNPTPLVELYLAHEIHFNGNSDNDILDHPDWRLLGLSRADVLSELEWLARQGHFIVQYGANLLRISWRYRSLQEVIDAAT